MPIEVVKFGEALYHHVKELGSQFPDDSYSMSALLLVQWWIVVMLLALYLSTYSMYP